MFKLTKVKSLFLVGGVLILLGTAYADTREQKVFHFSKVKSLTLLMPVAKCEELFADVQVPAPSDMVLRGKADYIQENAPIVITKSHMLTSFRAVTIVLHKAKDPSVLDKTIIGISNISLDGGKTFEKMPILVKGTYTVATHSLVASMQIGVICSADFTSNMMTTKSNTLN